MFSNRFRLALVIWALCALWVAQAQVPMTGAGKGTPTAGYVGPGDILPGAKAAWTLRCYNAAYAGNVADIYAPLDASHTLLTCSTGGVINETLQPLATTCAISCTIKTWYDQSGASICGGACDVTQATEATRPSVLLATLGGKPVVSASIKTMQSANLGSTLSQPNFLSAVADMTGSTISIHSFWGINTCTAGWNTGANTGLLYCGSIGGATVTTSAWHSLQLTMNGASSEIMSDGSGTSVNAGTDALTSGSPFVVASDGFGNNFVGMFTEIIVWNTSPDAGVKSSLNASAHSYWAF